MSILVVGDLMLDHYLWGATDRISPEAPVPVVAVNRETWALGGAGNVVNNLCALSADVALVSVTGTDAHAQRVRAQLTERNVSAAGVVQDASRSTTIKTRLMAARHQIVRFDQEQLSPVTGDTLDALRAAVDEVITGCMGVVLSDYGKGVVSDELAQYVIARATAAAIPVIVDPKGHDYRKYRGATLITPNRKEASEAVGFPLTDDDDLDRAAAALRSEHNLAACLITLSEDGMALFSSTGTDRIPTQTREVSDVTGAGDTVVAAIAVALAQGDSMLEACRFANVAAGVVVGKLGAATATHDEIRALESARVGTTAHRKLVAQAELHAVIASLRAVGKTIVFTNGCFDILHAGHVRYLESAAALGDVLIVGVNSDDSVRRLKGEGRPVNPEEDRQLVLAGLAAVTLVVPFADDTPLSLVQLIRPNVLVKGGDYTEATIVGAPDVRSYGGTVATIPLYAGRSTSGTIRRLVESESS